MGNCIEVKKIGITKLNVDAIVNAANDRLKPGGGVCGAVFEEAGEKELLRACRTYGHCHPGSAVITPGFNLMAKYIIHAVGPIWNGGGSGEAERLYSAYRASMELADENECHSIAFPLISAGIYGYPAKEAWNVALRSVTDYLTRHPSCHMHIIFAVLDNAMLEMGNQELSKFLCRNTSFQMTKDQYVFFWHEYEENGFLSQWYPSPFVVEGIKYCHAEQFMMAKKALLFEDMKAYFAILATEDPAQCKRLGKSVRNFDRDKWEACKEDVLLRANVAKFTQNEELKKGLIATGDSLLAEASPFDLNFGIGLDASEAYVKDPDQWPGHNIMGKILMKTRDIIQQIKL